MRTHCFSNENVFMHIGGTIHQFLTRDDSCPINLTLNLKNYTFTYCSRKNYLQIHTIFMVSVLLNPETQNKNIAKFRLIPWLEDCLQRRVKCCQLQLFHCCQCNSQSDEPMETFAESHKTARFQISHHLKQQPFCGRESVHEIPPRKECTGYKQLFFDHQQSYKQLKREDIDRRKCWCFFSRSSTINNRHALQIGYFG